MHRCFDNTDALCNAGTCSGHGNCINGVCQCDRLYSGDFCQNKGILVMVSAYLICNIIIIYFYNSHIILCVCCILILYFICFNSQMNV